MKLQAVIVPCLLLVAQAGRCASSLPAVGDKPGLSDRPGEVVSQFSVRESTQIPGHTLKPGSYNIRIVDHLSDRMIVRIDRDGKTEATFLALPSTGQNASGPILLSAGAGAKSALKGFVFANGTVAEFVYPKAEAVGLAKANGTKIPAIDPASEGRPSDNRLSPEDYEMVTLWLLSPTTVGPDAKAGILAQRYHSSDSVGERPAPSANAHNTPQVPANTQKGSSNASVELASTSVAPRPVRGNKPVMAVLPHTAGTMPLIWLTGLFAFCGAMLLTGRRYYQAR